MLLNIDRKHDTPLYSQIISGIKSLADEGALAPGAALPSTRSLAKKLGVDRTTVCRAYEELTAQGYLDSRPGSYTRVRKRGREAACDPGRKSAINWDAAVSKEARRISETFAHYSPEKTSGGKTLPRPVDLASLDPDTRLFPVKELMRSIRKVMSAPGAGGPGQGSLNYAAYQGYPPLRDTISQRMRLHGVSVSADEILITNGAQQAIDLASRLFASDGAAVALEAPTYSIALPLFRFCGLKLKPVPMTPRGMDLEALAKLLSREKVGFVYSVPNFQNPTGITTDHDHREKLLALCLAHRVPLVEDGFEEDMKYFGKVALPIKSMDDHNIVIYIGTFSKALFPGLRIGWMAADRECVRRLTAIKRFADLSTGHFVQCVMNDFCRAGSYDLHLRRLHKVYRKRLAACLKAMDEHLPKTATWTKPLGGYTLWVKMPVRMTERDMSGLMAKQGVSVSFGGYYFPDSRESEYFRLSIAKLDEDEIREGIARLGKALRAV
jgi:GntR family transcriptional regulator/MocR family aminotransferase